MIYFAQSLCAVMTCAVIAGFVLAFATPAMAEEDRENMQDIMRVLDSANAQIHEEIAELEQLKIPLPIGSESYYNAALGEYGQAMSAWESGYPISAKGHAMKAMNLFKMASDQLISADGLGEQTDIVILVDENIAIEEERATYLGNLAIANNVSVSYSDFDLAIVASKAAIEGNDLGSAAEHLGAAKAALDGIQIQIQNSADENKEKRVQEFVEELKTYLSRILARAEMDSTMTARDTLIKESRLAIQQLENTADVDEIIKITDESSRIQSVLIEYHIVLSSVEEESDQLLEEPEIDAGTEDESRDNDTTGGGTDDDEKSEEEELKEAADALEDRAHELLGVSDNAVATLKIQAALVLISAARVDIDEENYDASRIALLEAESELDAAEALIG